MNKMLYYLFISIVVGFLTGCATQVKTVEKPIYIRTEVPVQCDAKFPEKPVLTNNMVESNLLIMKYIKNLENTLSYCLNKNN